MPDGGGCRFGFRVRGPLTGSRLLCDWQTAFAAYAGADPAAKCGEEAYLSAFAFPDEFADHMRATGSPRGFAGRCWAPWGWLDIDREGDPQAALDDAKSAAFALCDRLGFDEGELLCAFSGGKGWHLGFPLVSLQAAPSHDFAATVRRLCETVAAGVGVAIDAGVYDRQRCFRAPNSRHPRTGLHKRLLALPELIAAGVETVRRLAEHPEPFEVPAAGPCPRALRTAWDDAAREVAAQRDAATERQRAIEAGEATPRLLRLTRDFIAGGAPAGGGDPERDRLNGEGRHRRLFAAAANLAECGAPWALVWELLREPALDCGLPPSDAERQARDGFARGSGKAVAR